MNQMPSPWMNMSPDQQAQLVYAQKVQEQQMLAQNQAANAQPMTQSMQNAFNYSPPAASPTPQAAPADAPAQADMLAQQMARKVPPSAMINQDRVNKFKFGGKK